MDNEIDLTEYLFFRLHQLGVRSVHGVPGDYNLTALDYLEPAGLHWVGNASELGAGYAADGYARVKGISALVTSFGVGELSAYNTIAAAYAEKSAVVHIVGTAPTKGQTLGMCLHHSLGDGNFRAFANIFATVTVAQANLTDVETAPALIDAALKACVLHNRPVYIELPTDMVKARVQAPDMPLDLVIPEYNEYLENEITSMILDRIYTARQPLILVDGFTARCNAREEVNQLVDITEFPTLTTPFGKSYVNEHVPNFCGIYSGFAGEPTQKEWVDQCDLVLHFGPLPSDVNTFGFTAIPPHQPTIVLEKFSVTVGGVAFPSNSVPGRRIHMKSLLQKVLASFIPSRLSSTRSKYPASVLDTRDMIPTIQNPDIIDQQRFWPYMSKFLRTGDIVLTETGTAAYGGLSINMPIDSTLINSFIWLSIGHMLGACQGVALAQRELDVSCAEEVSQVLTPRPQVDPAKYSRRTILFVGEGSLQMTAQSISDMIRNRLDILIIVLNNSGYTIERLIHGFDASYNDVQPWRNLMAPQYFGAPTDEADYPCKTAHVKTWQELDDVLGNPDFQDIKGLRMLEVIMEKGDAPVLLRKFADYLERRNSGKS